MKAARFQAGAGVPARNRSIADRVAKCPEAFAHEYSKRARYHSPRAEWQSTAYAATAPITAEDRESAFTIPFASLGEKISSAPAFRASAHSCSSASL